MLSCPNGDLTGMAQYGTNTKHRLPFVNAIRKIFELGSPTSGAEIWLRKGRA